MEETAALSERLDPLYAGPPEEFVAARDALAKELKGEGEKEAAALVKKLRRPSVAAALLNRVVLGNPKEAKTFAGAVAALRRASGRSGLKEAARAQREAASRLLDLASEEGGEGAALDRAAETLQAAAADEGVEQLLLRGRLEKEQRAASIGFGLDVSDAGSSGTAAKAKPKPRAGEKAKGPARAAKGRGRAAAAEKAKGPTAAERRRAAKAEKTRQQARKREQRRVEKAKRGLEAAVAEQVRADEATEAAKEALAAAKDDLATAKEAAKASVAAVREAKQELRERERELADLD